MLLEDRKYWFITKSEAIIWHTFCILTCVNRQNYFDEGKKGWYYKNVVY